MNHRAEQVEAEVEEKVAKMKELRKLIARCRLRLLSDGELWYLVGPSTTFLAPAAIHGDIDELEASLSNLLDSFDLLEHKPSQTAH